MANPEHSRKLQEGVQAWNKWRDEHPEVEIDLSEAPLTIDLKEDPFELGLRDPLYDFTQLDLREANLQNANLRNANFRGVNLERASLWGAHLEHAFLRDAHFAHANLWGAHLDRAVLRDAHLEHAFLRDVCLEAADLRDAHLEHADLQGASLERADLPGAHLQQASLINANLENANLIGAHLNGAILYEAKLHRADLRSANLQDASLSKLEYLYPLSVRKPGYRRRIMRGRFEGIRGLDSCYGNRLFVRDAADQDYLDSLASQWNGPWGRFWFLVWGLTDYGRSFMSVIIFTSLLMFGFGAAYSHWPHLIAIAPALNPSSFTPYYFSIVTYTTLGFGDVRPNCLGGEILVCIEVVLGYLSLGLLLAVLGNKIARRS